MAAISQACQQRGIACGWDLAHAVGNIELKLHDWAPDFAVWCCYKYLNGGPGTLGGLFVHQRHLQEDIPRMAGWWGYKKETRFKMRKGFDPVPTADGWALSNPPILSMAALKASLPMFEDAGMKKLRARSQELTTQARRALESFAHIEILTPEGPESGNMLTLRPQNARPMFERMQAENVVGDWREPGIIRVAFCPLYNTEADIERLAEVIAGT